MQYEQSSTWAIVKHLYRKYEQVLVEVAMCGIVITILVNYVA